ncbi:DEAD-domain-containing protein, partial [Aureobasidium sp. EXF-8845]
MGVYAVQPSFPAAKTAEEPSSPETPSPTLEAPDFYFSNEFERNGTGAEKLEQMGFARFVTDHVTVFYLTDVYIEPDSRGKGLGKWLISCCREIVDSKPHLMRAMLMASPGEGKEFYEKALDMRDIQEEIAEGHELSEGALRPYNAAFITRSLHQTSQWRQQNAAVAEQEEGLGFQSEQNENGPITTFAELGQRQLVSKGVVQTLIKDMGLTNMTEVQTATINQALEGNDIIAQARTGTGKTLGFLIPVLQNILKQDPSLGERSRGYAARRGNKTTADDIRAIIVSPTRELAEQIAVEAKRLVANTSVIVQTAVGGTQKSAGLRAIQRQGCHILVGTPGRLKDIFSDKYSGVEAPGLDALVFDEADRLLDQGFWPEIQEIIELLPKPEEKSRQTLMFSATVPNEVQRLVKQTLRPGYDFVKTVRDDEEPTHTRV